jgi:hypothetical protein
MRFVKGLPEAMADGTLAKRLRHDNALVSLVFKVIELCNERKLDWFACGAGSSYVWDLREWLNLKFYEFTFAGCAYGSGHPNLHKVRSNSNALVDLAAVCPGCKDHKPWRWASNPVLPPSGADKAELSVPKGFFAKVSEIWSKTYAKPTTTEGVASTALVMAKTNVSLVDANKERVSKLSSTAGWQARGRRLDQVVAERKSTVVVSAHAATAAKLQRRQRIKSALNFGSTTVPAESQVLELEQISGVLQEERPW